MQTAGMNDAPSQTLDPASGASGLAALFDANRRELLRFLAARCGSAEDAEDLLQELWIKLGAGVPGPIANGRAYLFRMANNLVLDTVRARRRAMRRDKNWLEAFDGGAAMPEDRRDSALPADEQIAAEQEAAILRRAIAELPPGAARALHLHRFEDMNQREVAEVMGISRSGVEKHLALAIKHLRKAISDCGAFDPVASVNQEGGREGESRPGDRS